jgi:hypothetical protein
MSGVAALVLVLGLGAGSAAADIRRMEAVGSEPLYAGTRPSRAPRDGAIQRAILEAVSRVAGDFLLDQSAGANVAPGLGGGAGAPSQQGPPPNYSKIFGRNLVQYTARYRIIEDRGEGPVLFAAQAGVESEYVVIVEVHVDADRVRQRLEEVGLLAPAAREGEPRRIVLEVLGLQVYPAYQALQTLLLEEIGASRVVPLEFRRGRVRLGIEYGKGGPAELLDELYARSPRELEITPVQSDELRLTIQVVWVPTETNPGEGVWPRKSGGFENFVPGRNRPVVESDRRSPSPASR